MDSIEEKKRIRTLLHKVIRVYLQRKGLNRTAQVFSREANLSDNIPRETDGILDDLLRHWENCFSPQPGAYIHNFPSSDTAAGRVYTPSPAERGAAVSGVMKWDELPFERLNSVKGSSEPLLCCDFSSHQTPFLACAGFDQKVTVWHMNGRKDELYESKSKLHDGVITDIKFRPESKMLATCSHDTLIKLWDWSFPENMCVKKFRGHRDRVMSLDFHPQAAVNLLASCDSKSWIKVWDVLKGVCKRSFKGGSRVVRIERNAGRTMAAAAGNVVNLFDIETGLRTQELKGHGLDVVGICWDRSGRQLASVSEDSVRVWSGTGECVRACHCNGTTRFKTCTFHPVDPYLLILGSHRNIYSVASLVENRYNEGTKQERTRGGHHFIDCFFM